jgi:small-conductance mechanosensitive channel
MSIITDIITYIESRIDIIQLLAVLLVSFIIFFILIKILKRNLLKKVKSKKQISNVTVFLSLLKFLFVFFLVIIVVAFFYGDLGDLSFVAGLLTVAVGWALQRPISGVVAWLILITRRPFDIGDRLLISNIKGDITDITLTHIFLDEVGGTIEGEEKSGRTVMVPTSLIFEKEIINYTHQDDYILVDIVTTITYESNLDKAEQIILNATKKIMEPSWNDFPQRISKEPHIRLQFKDSGIDVSVRYYTIALKRNEFATNIRREIFHEIRKTKEVEIAYPHTEVLFRNKPG